MISYKIVKYEKTTFTFPPEIYMNGTDYTVHRPVNYVSSHIHSPVMIPKSLLKT